MSHRHTLVHQLADWAERTPDSPAIHGKVDGEWRHRTWSQWWSDVRAVAKGLLALGHQPGDCVAIVGDNRMEWVTCQMAIMAVGGAPAPIYTTNTIEQCAYIVDHAKAKIAICDGQVQYDKYRAGEDAELFEAEHFVTFDPVDGADERTQSLDALKVLGETEADADLDARIDALGDTDVAMLIYTSGTTGVPKAVILEHGGLVEVQGSLMNRLYMFRQEPYRMVSYLPLCHAAEQLLTTVGTLATGGKVYFCDDLKQIREYLVEVRPTVFLGVPRVWEKFEAALAARMAEVTGIKAKLAAWARKTELEAFRTQVKTGQRVDTLQRKLANRLVHDKIKQALGLDELRVAVTGSAPIGESTLSFFASLGIGILEAYGMSETHGVCTMTLPDRPKLGTVGPALDGCEMKIAEDGEVKLKGRTMTRGYLHMPDETAALYDEDGWLCTGDLGEIDDEGHLKITGRKKDLIITAGGKNVAPVELEALMQQVVGIGQPVVVGDRQPYLAALISLDPEALPELQRLLSMPDATLEAIAASDALRTYLEREIEDKCNQHVARYQTIKRFHVLPSELTAEAGELTPTMKLRRNIVTKRYAADIEALYDAPLQRSPA